MGKSVWVHDDTHKVLKEIKSKTRSKSIDEIIRQMVKDTTGVPVERHTGKGKSADIRKFID
ncbi:MAG: hypothetical protein OK422_00890 [Thaumarchaeota archaeon]|nr:hypothetical protein [Nitrososphaerota archaeon]